MESSWTRTACRSRGDRNCNLQPRYRTTKTVKNKHRRWKNGLFTHEVPRTVLKHEARDGGSLSCTREARSVDSKHTSDCNIAAVLTMLDDHCLSVDLSGVSIYLDAERRWRASRSQETHDISDILARGYCEVRYVVALLLCRIIHRLKIKIVAWILEVWKSCGKKVGWLEFEMNQIFFGLCGCYGARARNNRNPALRSLSECEGIDTPHGAWHEFGFFRNRGGPDSFVCHGTTMALLATLWHSSPTSHQ